MKDALETLFGQYGDVVDVKAWKNLRMRGQAFVIFSDLKDAEKALILNGYPLFNKPMVCI